MPEVDMKSLKINGTVYKPVDETARQMADNATSIAKGANQAITYGDYQSMITNLNVLSNDVFNTGQNIMIVTLEVPDLWVSGVSEESVTYTYTSDEDFVTDLAEDGVVQVGYYVLSALETQKVDLTEYVKNTDLVSEDKAGLVRIQKGLAHGLTYLADGRIMIKPASNTEIDNRNPKNAERNAITTQNLDYAVKKALSDCKLTGDYVWTDEEKASTLELLGGVALSEVSVASITDMIVRRTINGNVNVPFTPQTEHHAASKGYVDDLAPFIATYGTTTYEEVLEAYKTNKELHLKVAYNSADVELTGSATEIIACFSRVDGGSDNYAFTFMCDEGGITRYYAIDHSTKKWRYWNCKYAESIDYLYKKMSTVDTNIEKLLPLLTSAYNSFRGGFRMTAGTLQIKHPGIYLIIQGGTGNKNIVITQNGTEVLNETWNAAIVMAYENGVITPVGISGVSGLGIPTFKTPGTYQAWIPGTDTHITTISYPAETVVAYLGNSNNDVGTWS